MSDPKGSSADRAFTTNYYRVAMFQIPDMSARLFVPERMDDTGGSEEELIRTLRDFRIVNLLFSRSRTLVKRYLLPHMLKQGGRELIVADLGAGGCDFALWFTGLCRRKGLDVRVVCIDNDPRAVAYCRRALRGRSDIMVCEASASSIGEMGGPIDYIFSNHFLHHVSRCGFSSTIWPAALRLTPGSRCSARLSCIAVCPVMTEGSPFARGFSSRNWLIWRRGRLFPRLSRWARCTREECSSAA
jgi:hypothetical protein